MMWWQRWQMVMCGGASSVTGYEREEVKWVRDIVELL
jgi:hypothetical protein